MVIAIIAILVGMLLPTLSKAKNKAQETIDFNNTRQTMLATHLYAGDDEDYLPDPTGSSNGSGPDGWAYGTEAMPRVTGSVSAARLRIQESNQVQAFRTGQLASYLAFAHKALMCLTDAVESRGSKRDLYLQRPIKIISYDLNGQVGGYIAGMTGRKTPLPSGKTFKISALRPTGILQWEKDELIPFYFNDTGNHPGEGISQRHGGGRASKAQADVQGGTSHQGAPSSDRCRLPMTFTTILATGGEGPFINPPRMVGELLKQRWLFSMKSTCPAWPMPIGPDPPVPVSKKRPRGRRGAQGLGGWQTRRSEGRWGRNRD